MRWFSFSMAGLLVFVLAGYSLAQIPEVRVGAPVPLPPVDDGQIIPAAGAEALADPDSVEPEIELESIPELSESIPLDGFFGYRYGTGSFDWIVGDADQFGMFSINYDHYKKSGIRHGLDVGMKFHFLSGPIVTDMPARVYDFSIAYQHRDTLGAFSYDVAASVMASSDFEGNSREGIRFPGHAVGFLSIAPKTELVFGVDYLDRGDIKLLPVGGLIAMVHPDVRLEAVFPRPRAVFQLTDRHQLYVGGELGGGTWAIERTTLIDDLATYRDLRLCIGIQMLEEDNERSAIEIGYLFDRKLEYTSGNGNFRPVDTAMIRMVFAF